MCAACRGSRVVRALLSLCLRACGVSEQWEDDEVQAISCECDSTCSGGIKLTFKDQTTG